MIRGTTRVAAVIGWPVEHSRSPQMFEAAFAAAALDAVMVPIGVPPEGLAHVVGGLRAMRALGASVTMPHKLTVAALCDELSVEARAIGAVNCLRFSGDRVIGHNTDCHGYRDALVAAGFEPEGKRCVILGAGGAARAVAYGLRAADAAVIDVLARRPQAVSWTQARAWTPIDLRAAFSRADLLVDATSLGLAGAPAVARPPTGGGDDASTGIEPARPPMTTTATAAALVSDVADDVVAALPLESLPPHAWVSSLIYQSQTQLLARAARLGHPTIDGRGMLVHQGARSFVLWTGGAPPIHAMARALDASLDGT